MRSKTKMKVYALRVLQSNSLEKVMTDEVLNVVKENNGALSVQTDRESFYVLATFVFKNTEERNRCFKELTDLGIQCVLELRTGEMDKRYWQD